MRKTVYLILAAPVALFGAFKVNDAFRHDGDFDAYALGVAFVALGAVLFWRFFSPVSRLGDRILTLRKSCAPGPPCAR
jgi:hypothetical protein